ncbi:SurA N-terminal domain-containing protein [Myxococcota bacterium]|nr:SurA N-terminal domain-containing protein [Myxococcota bacterium]MBU1896530.1 SurA N-terminal domain-containing protein [Myxococcota bacterium]
MLTRLREQSQSFLIFILFGMLIVVFIFFFGPQSQGWQPGQSAGPQSGWVAQVNDQEINLKDVEITVRRYVRDDVEPGQLGKLRDEARKQLIDQLTLAQRAAKLGFAPSEVAVSEFIVGDKNLDGGAFRDAEGNFDYERYAAQVTQFFGATTEVYRQSKARELIIRDYLDFLSSQIKVSEAELKAAFERKARKWRLDYLVIDPAQLGAAPTAPTPAEGAAYAAAHADEVSAYYEAHLKDYKREAEVKISRILVRLTPNATPEDKAKAKAKIEDLRKQAMAPGADFAALAEAHSEGYYKSYKGSMGWQSKENSSPKDYEVFAALKQGEISGVQESAIGFWFVKADEVKAALDKPLESVKAEIGLTLAKDAALKTQAKAQAEAMLARLKAGEAMEAVAPAPEAPAIEPEPAPEDMVSNTPPATLVKTTGQFSDERPNFNMIPDIGESPALARRLATLTDKAPLVDEVIEANGRFYLIRLKERVEPDMKAFEAEKGALKQRLLSQKGATLFGSWSSLLFGPAQQREMMMSFGGGALIPSLKDRAVVINNEILPQISEGAKVN